MKKKKGKIDCEVLEIFSNNMKFYRIAAGLSQYELANKSGYAHNFINDLENKKKGASFETVGKISKALDIEPFFLFINPNDRSYGENHKLIGLLTAFNKNVNNFFEFTLKELSGEKLKHKKK
jgi:transcriptional regulator with XRE-family HTH domain